MPAGEAEKIGKLGMERGLAAEDRKQPRAHPILPAQHPVFRFREGEVAAVPLVRIVGSTALAHQVAAVRDVELEIR